MTVYSTFHDALYDWIVDVTGFDPANVFRRNQENPDRAPGVNWATFKEITGDARDYPLEVKVPVGTAKEEFDTQRIFPGTSTVSVNIYADNGADILRALYDSRAERTTRKRFKDAKAVLLSMAGPRDLTLLSDTTWKARHQADFTFNIFSERTERDFIVDIVRATGKMDDDEVEIYVARPTGGN